MREFVLSDLLDYTRDGEWGEGAPAEGLVAVRVIRGTDFDRVRFGDLSTLPLRYIKSHIADRKVLAMGDVLIETAGGTKDQPTGRTVLINENIIRKAESPLICASFARFLRPRKDIVDPEYLFWKLQAEYQSGAIFPYHIQHTGVARFQYTQFATQHILDFPNALIDQQSVASVLSNLDDKIELNRRTSETLEAMGQAIFRDWFVEFGPVRRQLAGLVDPVEIMGGITSDPNRAAALAQLFPTVLGETGLPEGWRPGTLDTLADTAGESVAPAQLRAETPYIGLEHMPRRSIMLDDWDLAGNVSSQKTRFTRGQILFGKLRPYFHKVGLAPIDGICSTDIVVLDSHNSFDRALVASCVSSDSFVAFTDQSSSGTKMPRTSWTHMKAYELAIADESVRRAFSALVEPMHERIITSVIENRTLAETRDYLLPRLMSGAVRVADVETEAL